MFSFGFSGSGGTQPGIAVLEQVRVHVSMILQVSVVQVSSSLQSKLFKHS